MKEDGTIPLITNGMLTMISQLRSYATNVMEKHTLNKQVNIGKNETVGYFKDTEADKTDRIIGKLNHIGFGTRMPKIIT
jgi:hypothetical protein